MSRSKQTSKGRGRRRAVTAFGVAGALSLGQAAHPLQLARLAIYRRKTPHR